MTPDECAAGAPADVLSAARLLADLGELAPGPGVPGSLAKMAADLTGQPMAEIVRTLRHRLQTEPYRWLAGERGAHTRAGQLELHRALAERLAPRPPFPWSALGRP